MNKKALIYCRVSSQRQKNEGHGLDSQEQRCRSFARIEGYEVEKVFHDSASGGGDFLKRPSMSNLLTYLDKNAHRSDYVVIFDDLSRFARDTVFHLKLKSAFKGRGVELHCLNFSFDDSAEGQFAETIMAASNELEREKNKRQVIQKQKARLERGYWPFGAISGFIQINHSEHGKLLEPKEPRASIIKEALEGFAIGRFDTKTEVASFLKQKGYAKHTTIDTVDNLLKRISIYAGYVEYTKWEVSRIDGHHKPIISFGTYQRIKEKLESKSRTHSVKIMNPDFPLRRFVLCSKCKQLLTASWSTSRNGNKFGYYRCKTKNCEAGGKSVSRNVLEGEFEGLLKKIRPEQKAMELTKAIVKDVWEKKESGVEIRRRKINTRIKENKDEKDKLLLRIIKAHDEDVVRAYEERLGDLRKNEVVLKDSAMSFDENRPDVGTALEIVFDFLQNPLKQWLNGGMDTKRLVLKLVFEQNLVYNRKSGFETAFLSLPLRVFSLSEAQNTANVEVCGIEPQSIEVP